MSVQRVPKLVALEDSSLWREACDLAELVYAKLHELPEEEKWDTETKLRHAANDLMYYVAQAVGNVSPSGAEFSWAQARAHLFTLKTMYRFAGRQKFIELDPSVMNRLGQLEKQIDAEVSAAYEQTEAYNHQEQERWRHNNQAPAGEKA